VCTYITRNYLSSPFTKLFISIGLDYCLNIKQYFAPPNAQVESTFQNHVPAEDFHTPLIPVLSRASILHRVEE
jgi:hypothetical protein